MLAILVVLIMDFSVVPVGIAQAQERISPRESAEILPIESPVLREPTVIPGQVSFEGVTRIAEEYLEANPDGTLTLNIPKEVIKTIGRDICAQLQVGITQADKIIAEDCFNFNAQEAEKYLHIRTEITLTLQELRQILTRRTIFNLRLISLISQISMGFLLASSIYLLYKLAIKKEKKLSRIAAIVLIGVSLLTMVVVIINYMLQQ